LAGPAARCIASADLGVEQLIGIEPLVGEIDGIGTTEANSVEIKGLRFAGPMKTGISPPGVL
jgi:hypothetical protein